MEAPGHDLIGAVAHDGVGLTLAQVVAAVETLYPPATAQSWDRVGLVTGDPAQPVRRVHLAVDPTLEVVEEARAAGADLLLTHHPLLLRGVHSVATTTAKGVAVTALVRHGIALYCAHTNADVADAAAGGVGHALAAAVGLGATEPLELAEEQELGRVGDLPAPTTLAALATRLAGTLPPTAGGVRVAGPPDAPVRRVAVLGGAGDSSFAAVRRSGADVYVTADLRHHPALEAREEARVPGGDGTPYLIDAGHYASEWLWLPVLRDRLRAALGEPGSRLDVEISGVRTDPWDFVVGARGPDDQRGSS